MAFIGSTDTVTYGERIVAFSADHGWEAVIVAADGSEETFPVVGWAVFEKRTGDNSTHTGVVGAWPVGESGHLQTAADWDDEQSRVPRESRKRFKEYRRIQVR